MVLVGIVFMIVFGLINVCSFVVICEESFGEFMFVLIMVVVVVMVGVE